MDRRTFLNDTSVYILGSTGLPFCKPDSSILFPAVKWKIIKSIYPVLKKFIRNIIIEGVEEYAVDKLKDWIDKSLGGEKQKNTELNKIPGIIQNNNFSINGNDVQVYMGVDNQNRPTVSIFPLLNTREGTDLQILLRHSYIPIFKNTTYLDSPNFPEVVALNELANFYKLNLNLGKKTNLFLRTALLPFSWNTRTYFHVQTKKGAIGSCVFKTAKGNVHIIYEITEELVVEGEITFCPNDPYGKIPLKEIGFSHDFSKEDQY